MKGVEIPRHFRLDLQIIDQATFDRCQKLLKERSRPHVNDDHEIYAFTCLIRCSICGGYMVGNSRERVRPDGKVLSRTYVCLNRRRENDACPHGKCFAESMIGRGVLPFTASLLKQVMARIREALEVTAREMSEDTLRGHMEAEIRAGIGECESAREQSSAGGRTGTDSVGADRRGESGTCGEKGAIKEGSRALAEPVCN